MRNLFCFNSTVSYTKVYYVLDISITDGHQYIFQEDEMKSSSPRKASYISASYTEILRVTAEVSCNTTLVSNNLIICKRKIEFNE